MTQNVKPLCVTTKKQGVSLAMSALSCGPSSSSHIESNEYPIFSGIWRQPDKHEMTILATLMMTSPRSGADMDTEKRLIHECICEPIK
ncbi:protein of unknown function [Acidithiobacillus ferrivorans]|uniref:Uncharacterized protein n=1 Tax=Acidithiobacillus ferrivorans TaxID=160808 RepID=A0ABY1MPN7_9PROT|nr:protein of unknown function [Acidithiobacillus ferrivorans]